MISIDWATFAETTVNYVQPAVIAGTVVFCTLLTVRFGIHVFRACVYSDDDGNILLDDDDDFVGPPDPNDP